VQALPHADGIGVALPDTPFDVVDLDHCRDPETGDIDAWAEAWLHTANGAYIELTPSGEGLRIIGLGSGAKLHRRWTVDGERDGAAIEIYRNAERYITVTGRQVGDCTALAPMNGLLEQIRDHYDRKSRGGANAHDFNDDGAQGTTLDYNEIIRNGAPAGSDVSAVFHSVVGYLHAQGMTVDEIVEELGKYINGIGRRYPGRLQREVERCYSKWQSKRRIKTLAAEPDEAEPDEPNCWAETDKKGNPRPTCANARRSLLALGVQCRYDEFHDKHIVEGKVVPRLSNLDYVVADLRRKIHLAHGYDPGRINTGDALEQLCLKNRFNPILDYLGALRWDGTERLDNWLITYLGAADTELHREFGRLALLAAVRRVRRPGTKFDQIIVLEGPMGTQKSKAIELMAGPENFSDQAILGKSDKEVQELLQGIWLYEISELVNIRQTETEHIKAFASRTIDRARKAYGRFRHDQPRTPIMFATTNNTEYLKEADRRFWPVRTTVVDIDTLGRDRDQLWAEAAAKEPGASIVLRRGLWGAAAVEQRAREEHDDWDDILAGLIGDKSVEGEERVHTKDVFELVLKIDPSRMTPVHGKRIRKCMLRLGWTYHPGGLRIGDSRLNGYSRPTPEEK
jgi:hypothetical protein